MNPQEAAIRNALERKAALERLKPRLHQARQQVQALRGQKELATERVQEIHQMSALNNIPGFFPTPPKLVQRVIELAAIEPGFRCLEPSAGKGNLAVAMREAGGLVLCCEINPRLRSILMKKGFTLVGSGDFMEVLPVDSLEQITRLYDRIVMNPPFEQGQDRIHTRKAYDHLVPSGRLVSIMSQGTWQRSFKADVEFRNWVGTLDHSLEDCPDDAFTCSERPTGVQTCILTIDKAA